MQPLQGVAVGLGLTVASSLLNGLLAHKMLAASRLHRSIALEADARHLYTDVWTSAGVVVGVGLVQATVQAAPSLGSRRKTLPSSPVAA